MHFKNTVEGWKQAAKAFALAKKMKQQKERDHAA